MDPTAPKDDTLSANPSTDSDASGSEPNPIQPGQFVVAGGDDSQTPTSSTPSQSSRDLNKPSPGPFTSVDEMLSSVSSQTSAQVQSLPQQPQSTPTPKTTPRASNLSAAPPLPASPPVATPGQPDPTPYMPPQPTSPSVSESSKMNKLKFVFAIVAVLVLVGIIAFVVWFFVLGGGQSKESLRDENTQGQIEEPSPPPKRTTGGFGELPEATGEATGEAGGASGKLQTPPP